LKSKRVQKRKINCVEFSSDNNNNDKGEVIIIEENNKLFLEDLENLEERSPITQKELTSTQLLLMKKGKKLCEILLNSSFDDDALVIFNGSKSKIMNALVELSAEPVRILNLESVKERIHQWKNQ
jgi:hypothetical protein